MRELYDTWYSMKRRCFNPNHIYYKNYGGRGITICERWLGKDGYKNFCEDMGERPEGYTLDRVNNNGDYNPDNCRWASRLEQASNSRQCKGVAGVSYRKDKRKWRVRINIRGKEIFLSYFEDYHTACEARFNYELELEKQKLNNDRKQTISVT